MTSLELVMFYRPLLSFINSIRAQEPGYVELNHNNFLKKVRVVLADTAQNFLDSYGSAQGKSMPMYRFPKREATLMAMSYSHKSIRLADKFGSGVMHQKLLGNDDFRGDFDAFHDVEFAR